MGSERGVEDQQAAVVSVALLAIVGEGEDLGGLVVRAHPGVDMGNGTGGGIAGDEGEHSAVSATTFGDIVFLHCFVAAVGVEIEIVTAGQAWGVDGDEPQRDQLGAGGGVEATEVLSEGAELGDGVEPICVLRLM